MSRKVIGALLMALSLIVVPLPAYATEAEAGNSLREEYEEKEVIPDTGAATGSVFFTNPEDVVTLPDGSEYDKGNQLFVFRNGASILYSEAPDGMVQKSKVYLYKENASEYHLYKDGKELEFETEITVSEKGEYLVVKGDADSSVNILKFTIIGDLTGKLTGYQMPPGYRVISVTRNGEEIESDGKYVSFGQEGKYVVNYANPDIPVPQTLEVTTDFTEPSLHLNGVNEKGYAAGPVSLEDMDSEDSIRIRLNEKEIDMPFDHILRETGVYQIMLSDKAGNVTNYTFVIRPYLNVSAVIVLLMLVALIVSFIVFVVRTRKHLRVR